MREGIFGILDQIMRRILYKGPVPICESQAKINRRFSAENLLKKERYMT